MQLKYAFIVCAAFSFTACKPKLDAKTPEKGSIDATRYVSIGGSVNAGFADAALYYEGQENSFANLIAQQLKLVGGGNFNQPMMPYSSVGVGLTGKSRSVLGYKTDCTGTTSLSPVPFSSSGDIAGLSTSVYASAGPFNNMAVPNLKMTELLYPGYGNPANGAGNFNPFFTRMASNPATVSVLQDAVSMNPTFFTLSLGEHDILNYAATGGTGSAITQINGAPGVGFDGSVTAAVVALTTNGAKGVIANIPDVTQYPFFNTVPYNGLTLDANNAQTLNNALGAMGMSFQAGSNAFVIEDASLPLGARQILPGELILLSIPLDSVKCHKMGTLIPIPNRYVLTLDEITEIRAKTTAFNSVITTVASSYGLAVADVNALVKSFKTGVVFNGVAVNWKFVSGGAYSLDGLNLNPMGQALLANVFIKSMNQTFGSTIPQVDATKYRGVKFP